MKYIKRETGDHSEYFAYLEIIRGQLPENVYKFATDLKHYAPAERESLHDAWLEDLNIREIGTGARHEIRSIEIDTCYLGPYHDLRIYITYKNVQGYSLNLPFKSSKFRDKIGHGDVAMHETRFDENENMIIHEIVFVEGGNFEVQCETYVHRIELIENK